MLEDFQHLDNDAFWAFIFSKHPEDKERRVYLYLLLFF